VALVRAAVERCGHASASRQLRVALVRPGGEAEALDPWDLAAVDWGAVGEGHRLLVDLSGVVPREQKDVKAWSVQETLALVDGVERVGGGRWAEIKKLGFPELQGRSPVDLKDKWRNTVRVALQESSGKRKGTLPSHVLERVRQLAALHVPKIGADGRPTGGGTRGP